MIPGSNLLKMCLTLIAPQSIAYYAANGRALNSIGQDVTSYDEPIDVLGSFQPVSRQVLKQMGLDLQRSYYMFYTQTDMQDVERNFSPDLLVWQDIVLTAESNNDWFFQDKWKGVLVVESDLAVPSLFNGKLISGKK